MTEAANLTDHRSTPDQGVGSPTERPVSEQIRRHRPRCPFCLDDVEGSEQKQGCPSCMAWHHSACWEEAGSKCSACSASAPTRIAQEQPAPTQAVAARWGASAGTHDLEGEQSQVVARLRLLLAAANCSVDAEGDTLRFRQGSFLTQSELPRVGTFKVRQSGKRVAIDWEVAPATGFASAWILLWSLALCWLILPPILAYQTLVVHPRKFAQNLLAGL